MSVGVDPSPPAVSVVLPTFERRELVRRAVASVLSQSFRDFELIVVDDGSTDGTGEMLEGTDARLRYVWQENAGVAAARNRALKLARGPLIAFLDSDNRWLPDHLEVLTAVMERHPEAVLATSCPESRVAGRQVAADSVQQDLRHQILLYGYQAGFATCVVVRRQALARIGFFDQRIKAGEDTDLWVRLGTLGPMASVQRTTAVCQSTTGSLRERARRSGHYLLGAEQKAENLLDLAERSPDERAYRFADQARAELHLARALSALDRGEDKSVLATELAAAAGSFGLPERPMQAEQRVRRHLTQAHEPLHRLRAFSALSQVWPDQHADAARYLRTMAIATALRVGRPLQAARLIAGWRWRGTGGFARRVAPDAVRRFRQAHYKRRHPGEETTAARAAADQIVSGGSAVAVEP